MLPLGHRIAFAVFALVTLTLGTRGFYRMYLRIARGSADADARTDRLGRRLWYALKTTLLQTRVFRKRIVWSVFHSFIFYAFVLYGLVNLLDAMEGYVNVQPFTSPLARDIYGPLTDTFSVLAIVGMIAFLVRRFLLRPRDFSFNELTLLRKAVRRGYVKQDSIIVGAFILFHVASRVVGDAARLAMEGTDSTQPISSWLAQVFVGPHSMAWRIFGYWGALGSVLLFLVYFPYSKHIHLFMAPVKYFFRREAVSGELPATKIDLEEADPRIGAGTLADLSWPRLLDAYACIQCNRCQDVCPASQTGKSLSPSALEINKRMVLNSIAGEVSAFSLSGKAEFERGASTGPDLLQAIISPEAVWACTTCGACMEVCPTQDEQMLDIIDIRRNMVMLQGAFPTQLNSAFRGMERASNPWAISRDKRMTWAEGLHVPTVDEMPDPDVLYWIGCAASYDPSAQKTARAVVNLLNEAHVKFAVLGKRESCTGDSARRAGNELLYQQLAGEAIRTLNEVRPTLVIASCPHCVNTISAEYPQLSGHFTVMHHTEYLASMLHDGKLTPAPADAAITFHDPCYLGRHRGTYEQPRSVLQSLTSEYIELPRTKNNAFCCGAGGAQFWKEEERGTGRVSEDRFKEVQRTLGTSAGEKVLAVGCPFCKSMLQSTPSAGEDQSIVIKDVAELLWEGVQKAKAPVNIAASAAQPEVLREAPPATARILETPITLSQEVPVPISTGIRTEEAASLANVPPVPLTQTAAGSDQIQASEQAAIPAKTGRKKWTPKSASSPLSTTATPGVETAPSTTTGPDSTQSSTPVASSTDGPSPSPARKKWQPKSKQ